MTTISSNLPSGRLSPIFANEVVGLTTDEYCVVLIALEHARQALLNDFSVTGSVALVMVEQLRTTFNWTSREIFPTIAVDGDTVTVETRMSRNHIRNIMAAISAWAYEAANLEAVAARHAAGREARPVLRERVNNGDLTTDAAVEIEAAWLLRLAGKLGRVI